ncbi:hypothetical protein CHFL109739_11200 [Chryseobacterium flavum]
MICEAVFLTINSKNRIKANRRDENPGNNQKNKKI